MSHDTCMHSSDATCIYTTAIVHRCTTAMVHTCAIAAYIASMLQAYTVAREDAFTITVMHACSCGKAMVHACMASTPKARTMATVHAALWVWYMHILKLQCMHILCM